MVWFFLIPSIPAVLGNFVIPMMIGARDVAFPKLNLLSWYLFNIGGSFALYCGGGGRGGHGLDLLHALQHHLCERACRHDGRWRLYRRLRLHPYRPEFHRHDSQDARPGHDVVPAAAVHLEPVFNQPHSGAGHAGAGDHACWHCAWSASGASAFSIPILAAIRFCSSTCSGSIRIRRFIS